MSRRRRGRRKHVPQRTCVACRSTRPKRELVRVVRTVERAILVDETGKRNGRGAYLCVRWSCWEKALAGGQLSRALSVEIPAEVRERLLEYAAELPQPLGAEDKRQYQEAGEGVAEYE